jgi:hypothetical protein
MSLTIPPPIPPGSPLSVRETINQILAVLRALTQVSSPDHAITLNPSGFSFKNLPARTRITRQEPAESQILFGRPTGAYDESGEITLDPCDADGTDLNTENADDHVPVYVKPPRGVFSPAFLSTGAGLAPGTPNCELTSSIVCAYIEIPGSGYMLLGDPMWTLTGFEVDGANKKLKVKGRFTWGLFSSTDSEWMDVHIGTAC